MPFFRVRDSPRWTSFSFSRLFSPFYQFAQGSPFRFRLVNESTRIPISYRNAYNNLFFLWNIQYLFDFIIEGGNKTDGAGPKSKAVSGQDQVGNQEADIG